MSAILRDTEGNGLVFWCPGCDMAHRIQHGAGPGPRWSWDGNVDLPTFSPSVLVTSGHHVQGQPQPPACETCNECAARGDPTDCKRCHSFVRGGQIQFLDDCTHPLRGKTVPLSPFPHTWE